MREQSIYFVTPAGDGLPDLIKIGYSANLRNRCWALGSEHGMRMQVLASAPGGKLHEAALHHCFASARVTGEWFMPTRGLLATAALVAKTGRLPAAIIEMAEASERVQQAKYDLMIAAKAVRSFGCRPKRIEALLEEG